MDRLRGLRGGTLLFYYMFTLCAAVYGLRRDLTAYNALLAAAALALPAVPFALYRVCRLRPVYLLEIVFDWFVLAAVPFASLFGGYEWIPCWDKLLHFLSGFLFAVLGMVVYFAKKPGHALDRADAFNASLYTWMFAVLSAVLWEIWEYAVSFSGADPQQVASTGVGDTMQDMIVCLIGSLFVLFSVWRYYHKGKAGPMMRIFLDFYELNLK